MFHAFTFFPVPLYLTSVTILQATPTNVADNAKRREGGANYTSGEIEAGYTKTP
jgi:hypothetical protein